MVVHIAVFEEGMKRREILILLIVGMAAWVMGIMWRNFSFRSPNKKQLIRQDTAEIFIWMPPDTNTIPHTVEGDLIRYGRLLIVHTARYLGPKGTIANISNGMNCQNCHLSAGTLPFANNFSLVATTYPKYRARNDRVESIAFRVNACMKRSLNGKPLDTHSREMKAMVAYLSWVGKNVPPHAKVWGSGTAKMSYLKRAADPARGQKVFVAFCQKCHGAQGEGLWIDSLGEYQYPPLWGMHSYNTGAGIYRISLFAAFVKNNMPFGTSYLHPQLSDEQAWDVAAFVNSQPRPMYPDLMHDWPRIADKPLDYPYGPYADSFTEKQHKYGPFEEMKKRYASEHAH